MTGIRKNDPSQDKTTNGFSNQHTNNLTGEENINIDEFRANVELMNRLMAESVKDLEKGAKGKTKKTPSDTIIDGNFLSAVFAVVFLMIICVSVYAFYNLFVAILKKFPSKHTEL
ncbi:uncharacterized protein LOC128992747 [Macrosteles quadrilineatus]|uniref:uncharacterized protein LOC128992747 n=1 Tax=Macrosteles quadrilineatus TaxID=74068 RepID=UPI0023E1AA39|nr:uncharacterized protein LOC128992747 [Macrosteles quadrilineatus]